MNKSLNEYDTIVAISTPRGHSGIGVIRISGPAALEIATQIFRLSPPVSEFSHRIAVYGRLVDPYTQKILDDGLAIFFKGPVSYTGEDVIELSLHGSPVVLDAAVRLAIRCGARPAAKGEFTRRAFLAGKLDLLQAEAVIDLIESRSLAAAEEARCRLDKSLSSEILALSNGLKDVLAELEAHMDFDEDEEYPLPDPNLRLVGMITKIEDLKRGFESGRMRREGIRVVISGKPNVGKSTLFNALVRSDRVIVTPYPGTTRDTVDDCVVWDGIAFLLSDTAGLRENPDPIESEGIRRTHGRIQEADVVVAVIDGSCPPDEEDRRVLVACQGKKTVLIFNKMDLGLVNSSGQFLSPDSFYLRLSAKTGEGVDALEKCLSDIGRELLESGEHGGVSFSMPTATGISGKAHQDNNGHFTQARENSSGNNLVGASQCPLLSGRDYRRESR